MHETKYSNKWIINELSQRWSYLTFLWNHPYVQTRKVHSRLINYWKFYNGYEKIQWTLVKKISLAENMICQNTLNISVSCVQFFIRVHFFSFPFFEKYAWRFIMLSSLWSYISFFEIIRKLSSGNHQFSSDSLKKSLYQNFVFFVRSNILFFQ